MTGVVRGIAGSAWPLAMSAAAFTVAVGLPSGDPDMWWHLASGRWMVEHRDVLRVDIFSSTVTGAPYALGETWGEIALYLAYAAGSWTGLAILRAVCVSVAAFALTRCALRFATPGIAVPLAAVALVLSKPTWTDRPQLATLALFPVLLDLLFSARDGRRRALVLMVPLIFVWSALHAGYAVGIGLMWLFAVAAFIERRPAWGFVAAAAAATFAVSFDPAALSLGRALDHVGGATRGIAEESPVDVLTPFGALFALAIGAMLVSFLVAGADVLAALVLCPMLLLALSAERYIPYFGFALVPFLARSVAKSLADRRFGPRRPPRLRTLHWTPAFSAATALLLWVGALASVATADPRPDLRAYPVAALAAVRGSTGVLFNEYDWGGYLIWNAPERPVFIDGRLFPFVADDVFGSYRRAIHVLPGWSAALDRWNVTQALVDPGRPLVQALLDEGWTVRRSDSRSILLERPK